MKVRKKTSGLAALVLIGLLQVMDAAQAADSLAVRFLYAFGGEGDAPGQFRAPMALSLDPKGALYIADTGNNRIQKCSATGAVLAMVGGFGWGENQFHRPTDLAAENGLDIFIADYENRRLVRFDSDLHWIDAYYYLEEAEEKLSLGFPSGIAHSFHGDLFIVDAENVRILKVNALREPVFSFGDFAEGDGDLEEPQKIAIDIADRVCVSDRQRGCIMVYDYFGNYLQEIGLGILKEPTGLCADRRGSLFVADVGRDQVIIFGQDGRLQAVVGASGKKLGAFDDPSDVAVDSDRMYVTEAGNHRVQVFELQWLRNP
jgi:tripartite motif-containing protein 71